MTKAKMKLVAEIEYEINPEYYPEGLTKEEMLALDVKNMQDNPLIFFDHDDITIHVTGELL